MKWQNYAVDDLKRYVGLKRSIESIGERISILEAEFTGLKGTGMDSIPSGRSGSKREDHILNNIVERRKLKRLLFVNKKTVSLIEKGLEGLNEAEKIVLHNFFIARRTRHVEVTMDELNIERSHVYRIKQEALEKFTRSMFGISEL